jgi:hypothetical protein
MKSIVKMVDLPSRSSVLDKLAALADDSISPDEASQWAETWLLVDQTPGTDVKIDDWPVWEALKLIAGADLQVEPGSYLHGTDDFRAWHESLRTAPLPANRGVT